jgi:hypothetical protein
LAGSAILLTTSWNGNLDLTEAADTIREKLIEHRIS